MQDSHPTFRHSPSGAALVSTLAILTLLLALTIALFLSATNERRNASLYKHSQGLRELTDTATNLVMAQIKDATTATATLSPAERQTWASQPGMIRTYGTGTSAHTSYKLYSWETPRASGDANDTIPIDWYTTPSLFVDLNEPVPDSTDPENTAAFRYPIAYPPVTGATASAGYTIDPAAPLASTGSFINPVPMPVQWLYVLEDGALKYPSSTTGSVVTIPDATADNPIVARVAYWTDDETSKVNLNTAAGGEYWAMPVQRTPLQFSNSLWQPTRWEFQRYPGHPARTDVTKVFPPALFGFLNDAAGLLNTRRKIWELIPRVTDNGATSVTATLTAPPSVPYDMDRLFASVGETRFSAKSPVPIDDPRPDFIADAAWKDRIERSKFLVTSASRAPETTAYGTPRVAIWPINNQWANNHTLVNNTGMGLTTALDRLIAFASTIQNDRQRYYFVRSTPDAIAADVTANERIFQYLESLSDVASIPGFNSTGLTAKYGADGRNQLLTQFYDYIRLVNRLDTQLTGPNRFSATTVVPPIQRTVGGRETFGFGRFPTFNQIAIQFICTADAATAVSNVPQNMSLWNRPPGSGGTFTPLAAGQRNIMALAILEVAMPASGYPSIDYRQMHFTVRGMDQLRLNGQPLGFPAVATVAPRMGLAADTGNINVGDGGGVLKYLAFFVSSAVYPSGPMIPSQTNPPAPRAGFTKGGNYPLASEPVRVPETGDMALSGGGAIQVDTRWPNAGSPVFSTQSIPFPDTTVPVPSLPAAQDLWVYYPNGWNDIGAATLSPDVTSGRFPIANRNQWDHTRLIQANHDAFASVATAHGDYRISMVRPMENLHWGLVPRSTSNPAFAHRLFNNSGGTPVHFANYDPLAFGILAPRGLSPRPPVPTKPELDALAFAHPLTFGDFDNALPNNPDGAYINAPDEVGGWQGGTGGYAGIYWTNAAFTQHVTPIHHTPNRKIASAVAFGSLPSAAVQDRPWQTLLFRPAPGIDHPGKAGFNIDGTANATAPADNHWLDFFWMPVVEPYAISENFSTAGKINMNFRIAPFSYINRTTGLEAVVGSSGVTTIPSAIGRYQHNQYFKSSSINFNFEALFPVNVTETLEGFRARMNANNLFRAASEITELPIVPQNPGATFASLTSGAWWQNYRYTGDNTREATYNDIYPRLTTRSNTFTVHYRVQVLKNRPGSLPNQWDEPRDSVLSELRGNTLIERYLDPNAVLPNYTTEFATATSLDNFYRFRILQRSDFTP